VTASGGDAGAAPAAETPSLTRRMACFCYEAMLLFGIALVPGVLGAIFVAQTGQHHALQSETALRIYALVLDAIYFVGLWSTRGQTLAMQTWRIRLVTADGGHLSQGRALLRFAACCIAWLGVPTALASALHSSARCSTERVPAAIRSGTPSCATALRICATHIPVNICRTAACGGGASMCSESLMNSLSCLYLATLRGARGAGLLPVLSDLPPIGSGRP